MNKTFLVTGGAGYIGTNLIYYFLKNGYCVIVADNLSNSSLTALQNLEKHFNTKIPFYEGDLCDEKFTDSIFEKHKIDSVVHLAGKKYVHESFAKKDEYININNNSTKVLLSCMDKANVKEMFFASSITVFGDPVYLPMDTNHPLNPQSPYAQSKLDGENMIKKWQAITPDARAVIFRFSNPVGARNDVMLGDNPTSGFSTLLPYLVRCTEANINIAINGNNHPTKDGSCVRDFIDIKDLTEVVYKICSNEITGIKTIIVGNGKITHSVLDFIKTLEQIYNKKIDYKVNPARPNEVPLVQIDNSYIVKTLNYSPKSNLYDMVKSQVDFEKFIRENNV